MKHIFYLILFLSCNFFVQAQDVLPKPNPPRLVVDEAHVLSPEQQHLLEARLVMLDDSTSNQIAIVTIPSLDDYPIEDYANKLFRTWGIGGKKNNNGVLILVAVNDRKMRIEVGYGLEGTIPDVIASSIIDNNLKPNFKQGDYYRGFIEATTSLGKAAAGEYREPRQRKSDESGGGAVFFVILVIVVVIVVGMGRGGGGKGGGGMISRRGYSGHSDFFWAGLIGSALGGGGGGRSSGGWSGGGGGFGGFGGGSSGGGGASGSW